MARGFGSLEQIAGISGESQSGSHPDNNRAVPCGNSQETSGIKPIGQLLHRRMRESIVRAGNSASVPARIRRETHKVEPVSENEAETQRTGEEASEDHACTYPIGAVGESREEPR